MQKYRLAYEPVRQGVKEVEVESTDIRSALNAAKKIDGFTLEYVEEVVAEDSDKEAEYLGVYAFCEGCGLPICHEDDYRIYGEDCVCICMKCDDEAAEDRIKKDDTEAAV